RVVGLNRRLSLHCLSGHMYSENAERDSARQNNHSSNHSFVSATFLVEKRGKFLLHSPQLTLMLETQDLCLSSTHWPQTPQAFRRCSHFRREGEPLPFLY